MSFRTVTTFVLAVVALFGALTGIVIEEASADQIEPTTSDVVKVNVVYAEPMPTHDTPNRQYFETNDGASYRYVGYRACVRDGAVPTRVCRTVFWYAR